MTPPPPLPRPLRHAIFYGRAAGGIRFDGPKVVIEQIKDAHQQAEQWLAGRPNLEVLTISNGSASNGNAVNAVFVTVWYREPAR
ncbi:hypothetical protein [Haloferula sargassicola]|uniref:Uncharacterized protein n=1 Tax=Haloferula sargassicola TaxID=490096 RepID=A0ABP9USH8_9BACT